MTRSLTSAERVLHALRELILAGELTPGARLGEVELADRLGVSRTPVREALSRLAAEGIVEIQPNRGARVATWTVAELEGVFDRMLEVGCPGPAQDLDALVPLNRAFHDLLVALADHPTLATALAAAIRPPIVLRNFHAYDEASLRRSLAHHVEIVAAIRAGDPVWARAVMTAHIHNARTVMVRAATHAAGTAALGGPQHTNEEAS